MKIRHIDIQNFRGIKNLNWHIVGDYVCLLGPGDATKSTVMLAIEYALYPAYALVLVDTDFYNQDLSEPIVITVTVGDIPDALINEKKFGLRLRGWAPIDGIHDEPFDHDEKVLTIRLTVDDTLEPHWNVITERHPEGQPISHSDREKLGASPIGSFIERDLSWTKGSPLFRLTGNLTDANQIMLAARRGMRQSIFDNESTKPWMEQCTKLGKIAESIGVKSKNTLTPAIDFKSHTSLASSLTLYDGDVPTRQYGLGSKRLLSMSVQQQSINNGAVLLIDEIEHGLEPHRLRHLIRYFRQSLSTSDSTRVGQIIFTTHSSISIVECNVEELNCVINREGVIQVITVDSTLKATARAYPEAFLGRKIIVGEGKTEFGVCRGLDQEWGSCFGVLGIVPVNGGGYTNAPKIAIQLKKLGYDVALIIDSDQLMSQDHRNEIEQLEVCLLEWDGETSIEERFFFDMPWSILKEELQALITYYSNNPSHIFEPIRQLLEVKGSLVDLGQDIDKWLSKGITEVELRTAVGKAAHKSEWYKDRVGIDLSQPLGQRIAHALDDMEGTNTYENLTKLKRWLYV